MHLVIKLLFLLILLAGTGCHQATTHLQLIPLEQAETLNTSDVIVEGHVTQIVGRPNLTFAENFLSPGMPANPKHGWMGDLSMCVEKQLKGSITSSVLFIEAMDCREEKSPDPSSFPDWFGKITDDSLLRVGWQQTLGFRHDYKIVVLSLHPKQSNQKPTLPSTTQPGRIPRTNR